MSGRYLGPLPLALYVSTHIYIRGLVNENNVSFQMCLILLSFIAHGSKRQISTFKQCQSNTQMSVFYFLGVGSMRRRENLLMVVFSVNKETPYGTSLGSIFSSFISFIFEILSYLAFGEKIIRIFSIQK